MDSKPLLERLAYSPGEFATLFGKSQTWGYRQIYAGKVKAITEHGRILIPKAELDKILQSAGIYDGMKPKALKTKAAVQLLTPSLPDAWRRFLAARRGAAKSSEAKKQADIRKRSWPTGTGRKAALARLAGGAKTKQQRS